MGFFEGAIGIMAVIAILIVLPKNILSFVSKNNAHKKEFEIEKLKYKKEILELELEKQKNDIRLLELENKKYDNIINS